MIILFAVNVAWTWSVLCFCQLLKNTGNFIVFPEFCCLITYKKVLKACDEIISRLEEGEA